MTLIVAILLAGFSSLFYDTWPYVSGILSGVALVLALVSFPSDDDDDSDDGHPVGSVAHA
jgi:hypothetical protein